MELTTEYREIFTAEANDHLDEWESALLALEEAPGDRELINQMFRAIHTLKGSAGFIGFDELQRLSHDLESALQDIRDGAAALTKARAELLFEGLDLCKRMVEAFTDGRQWSEEIGPFLERLAAASAAPATGPAEAAAGPAETSAAPAGETPAAAPGATALETAAEDGAASQQTLLLRRFRLEVRIVSTGREAHLRAFLLRSRLQSVGEITAELPDPDSLDGSDGRLSYAVIMRSEKSEAEIRAAANIDQVELVSVSADDPDPVAPQTVEAPTQERRETGAKAPDGERGMRHDEVVRVSVERLDNLLNLVGELVVQNSNFFSLSEELLDTYGRSEAIARLAEKTEGLAKITRDLQDGIMKVRMLPINTVFTRFQRVVRDLAHGSGKDVALEIFGGETEIDKKVIDRIGDPLVHLVRNAVDHGAEGTEERLARGKPPTSTVRLGAYQDGDHICVEVSDDGRGLDPGAILRKAQEKRLVPREVGSLGEEQMLNLIFLPGFSTAERVTDVSGRGVGMDVVKKTIEQLGGSLRIRSRVGEGTTVTITLPLTMAIIRAVLVEVAGMSVAIPLSAVKEIVKAKRSEMRTIGGRSVIRLRDEVLAVTPLRELLEIERRADEGREAETFPVIVVDFDGKKIGLGVDRIIGTQEIVIKSLSRHYEEVEGFIGASILGDGSIALIIDTEAVIRSFYDIRGTQLRGIEITSAELGGAAGRIPGEVGPARRTPARRVDPEAGPSTDGGAGPEPATDEPRGEAEPEAIEQDGQARLDAIAAQAAEALSTIGSSGALRASMALSQMTGIEVRVGFPDSAVVRIADVAEEVGGEETSVGGIYVGISGELTGGILIVVPEGQLERIHSLLVGAPAGADLKEAEVDLSVISEFGNLLSASFINALADDAGLAVHSEAPELSIDMCLPVMDSVLARFDQMSDRILLTKAVVFFGDNEEVGCSLLLFLEPASLTRTLEALAVVSP